MSLKMTNKPMPPAFPSRQAGAALITGLIFLVVLTMIGITAARMSTLEERMSGNMRDRAVAMQAAELALRDAERDVTNAVTASARNISGLTDFSADCGTATGTTADDGLCYSGPGVATTIISGNGFSGAISTTAYGDYTGATGITGLSAQPRYAIEGIKKTPPGGGGEVFYYRITARAQGVNPNTVVWLQEVFRP
jgi:type IV pilus assembly protein PilX